MKTVAFLAEQISPLPHHLPIFSPKKPFALRLWFSFRRSNQKQLSKFPSTQDRTYRTIQGFHFVLDAASNLCDFVDVSFHRLLQHWDVQHKKNDVTMRGAQVAGEPRCKTLTQEVEKLVHLGRSHLSTSVPWSHSLSSHWSPADRNDSALFNIGVTFKQRIARACACCRLCIRANTRTAAAHASTHRYLYPKQTGRANKRLDATRVSCFYKPKQGCLQDQKQTFRFARTFLMTTMLFLISSTCRVR